MPCRPRRVLTLFALAAVVICTGVFAQDDRLTGIIYPIQDLDLSLPLDGTVTALKVRPGERVTKDTVLLQLDDRLQRLEVERRERIWRDDSQLQSARENLELLESLVATKEELFANSRTVSESELKRNQIQLNQVQGEFRALEESQARAELEYRIAAAVLDSYQLKAPIAGEIVDIVPAIGEWVRTGETAVRLVDIGTCYLDIDVELATARRISSPDAKVRVRIGQGDDTIERDGSTEFVSTVADSGSGLVRVKVYFDNTDRAVTPGVTGQLVLE